MIAEPSAAGSPVAGGRPSGRAAAERELVGSAALVGGALFMVQMNGLILWAGALGAVIHIVGWFLLPHGGARRITAAVLSPVAVLTMLLGPTMSWAVAIPLALWFLVHRVTGRTYVLVLIPLIWAIGIVSAVGTTGPRLIVFGSVFAAACLTGWVGLRLNRYSPPETGRDISADS